MRCASHCQTPTSPVAEYERRTGTSYSCAPGSVSCCWRSPTSCRGARRITWCRESVSTSTKPIWRRSSGSLENAVFARSCSRDHSRARRRRNGGGRISRQITTTPRSRSAHTPAFQSSTSIHTSKIARTVLWTKRTSRKKGCDRWRRRSTKPFANDPITSAGARCCFGSHGRAVRSRGIVDPRRLLGTKHSCAFRAASLRDRTRLRPGTALDGRPVDPCSGQGTDLEKSPEPQTPICKYLPSHTYRRRTFGAFPPVLAQSPGRAGERRLVGHLAQLRGVP